MNYFQKIQALKDEERSSNPSAKYLVSKIFTESCINAVGRSRVHSSSTKQEALDEAINLFGNYDFSTSEWYKDEFADVEIGDPAMDAALADLAEYHRITLGDFNIEIDELEN